MHGYRIGVVQLVQALKRVFRHPVVIYNFQLLVFKRYCPDFAYIAVENALTRLACGCL